MSQLYSQMGNNANFLLRETSKTNEKDEGKCIGTLKKLQTHKYY